MMTPTGDTYKIRIVKAVLRRNLLQTLELIIQNSPDEFMFYIDRHGGLGRFIRNYPDQMLWRTFSQAHILKEEWDLTFDRDQSQNDIFQSLNPELVLQYAGDNNKPKLFQYILKTLSEIRRKSITVP